MFYIPLLLFFSPTPAAFQTHVVTLSNPRPLNFKQTVSLSILWGSLDSSTFCPFIPDSLRDYKPSHQGATSYAKSSHTFGQQPSFRIYHQHDHLTNDTAHRAINQTSSTYHTAILPYNSQTHTLRHSACNDHILIQCKPPPQLSFQACNTVFPLCVCGVTALPHTNRQSPCRAKTRKCVRVMQPVCLFLIFCQIQIPFSSQFLFPPFLAQNFLLAPLKVSQFWLTPFTVCLKLLTPLNDQKTDGSHRYTQRVYPVYARYFWAEISPFWAIQPWNPSAATPQCYNKNISALPFEG